MQQQPVFRPKVPDAGVPDWVDAPCTTVGHWVLDHSTTETNLSTADECWPPDGLTVTTGDQGCDIVTPDTLPGSFAQTTTPVLAHCRIDGATCLITLDLSASTFDKKTRLASQLELEMRLRQLGDGTFLGETQMTLTGCGSHRFDTTAAP